MNATTSSAVAEAYQAARVASLAVRRPPSGILRATGGTRLDLIQRLSTNDLAGISRGEVRTTILTTAIGRIVDRLEVLALGDALFLVTSAGREETVQQWLRRHIFFQDDVEVAPAHPAAQEWFVLGPQASVRAMETLGLLHMPRPGQALEIPGGLLWATRPPEPEGIRLVTDLSIGGSPLGRLILGADDESAGSAFEAIRIESGYPLYGHEFDDGDIPLESGLTYAVSFTKGCYLGQEIIARMESRARIPRRLMGAMVDGPVETPADIHYTTGLAGRLTSAAYSPRHGWIGLAVVRPDAAVASDATRLSSGSLRLIDLPFPDESRA